MTTLAIVRFEVPVLVSVTVWAALGTLTSSLPKLSDAGTEATGAVPVPVRVTVCGLPEALSAIDTVALRLPVAVGVNVAAIVHVPSAATVPIVRQSLPLVGVTRAKSPGFVPVKVTLVIVNGPVPELVNVDVDWTLVVCKGWLPNGTVVGAKPTPGVVPVPVNVMTCVAGVALSVNVIVALRGPVVRGENVAATTQLELAASVVSVRQSVPLAGVANAKSATFVPPRITLEIFSVAFPVFDNVTVCWPLVSPVSKLANAMVVALKLVAGCIAVPFNITVCGLLGSDAAMESVAVRLVPPVGPGSKITLTTQVPVVATKVAPGQESAPNEKSLMLVPVICGVLTVTELDVGLLSVTACGALADPTAWALKVSEIGLALTSGFDCAPVRLMLARLLLVL
jgi:hypothetical protein